MADVEGDARNPTYAAAVARSKMYRLLSYCFFHPEEKLWNFLQSSWFVEEVGKAARAHPRSDLLPVGIELPRVELSEGVDEYVRLLSLNSRCPPYENQYHASGLAPFSTEPMADVAGFYRAFGMGFAERPDHIACELEFMHLASLREAEALLEGEAERAELCADAQRKFLDDHLGRWTEAFREALSEEGSVFYLGVCGVLSAWLEAECDCLGAFPDRLGVSGGRKLADPEDERDLCGEEIGHERL